MVPETEAGATVGASGSTVMTSVATGLELPDESVACTDREKFLSLLGRMDSVV
jgi:hypothetical protein